MTKYFLLLILFVLCGNLFGQSTLPISETIKNEKPDYRKIDSIAKVLKLKGGDIVKVYAKFAINEVGDIVDIKTRGPHEYFEKEAVRILKKVPRLDPAIADGKPIKAHFSLPISFRIETKRERKKRLAKENRSKSKN
ncbi:energy transducer TonB [Flavobacteriaceae bacterium 3-367]